MSDKFSDRKVQDMKSLKKLFLFASLLIIVLTFAGCMTVQVEIRQEYDKLTRVITAMKGADDTENRDEYCKPANNDDVKGILGYIWDKMAATKGMVETFAGKTKEEITAVNPLFSLMQSVLKDGQSQSAVTEFPYYIKDAKVSVMTMGFSAKNTSAPEYKTADAHFMFSVTGTAINENGAVLKDNRNNDITYTTMVILQELNPALPSAPIENLSFHKYQISADSPEIPVYNLIYTYVKTGGEWKICEIKDSGIDSIPFEELAEYYK